VRPSPTGPVTRQPRRDRRPTRQLNGNDYRLVVAVRFAAGLMFVRFVGTHTDFDRIDAADI